MYLKNHIALRLLSDPSLSHEICHHMYNYDKIEEALAKEDEKSIELLVQANKLYSLMDAADQKAFLVTHTVLDKLEMLKVKPNKNNEYDWGVFNGVKSGKYTFVLPQNDDFKYGVCLRVRIEGDFIEFAHIAARKDGLMGQCDLKWVLFFVERSTNRHCDHFKHSDVSGINEFTYKLMCFIFLSENTEEEIKPGQKHGTRKQDKTINVFPVPLTIINSKWNVTSIRTEGFEVSAHFALRWIGPGRQKSRMVFINSFEKHGYIRKSPNKEKLA